MKKLPLLVPLVIMTAALALAWSPVSAKAPGPSAGTMVAGDLVNPRGIAVGPDHMLYVAEAGSGGDMSVTNEDGTSMSGFTGRISKIDPATGARTTIVDGLPSNGVQKEGFVGPAAVAFLGDQMYYVQTHGGAAFGFPSMPTGVYTVNGDGTVSLFANLGDFNLGNPVTPVRQHLQPDIEPGGNPYSMIAFNGALYISDGNQNQVLKVGIDHSITRIADFPQHVVTTGIAAGSSGQFFVATLGLFPFKPSDGRVYSVGMNGTITQVASGVSALTDVALSNSGQLYALQFAAQAPDLSHGPFAPFSGTVLEVNANGTLSPVVTGFTFATAMAFDGDTLYVVNNGVSALAPGEVWAIPNFSSIAPGAPIAPVSMNVPVPTTAPAPAAPATTGVISPPNTGTGAMSGDRPWWPAFAVLALVAFGLTALGTALATRRR